MHAISTHARDTYSYSHPLTPLLARSEAHLPSHSFDVIYPERDALSEQRAHKRDRREQILRVAFQMDTDPNGTVCACMRECVRSARACTVCVRVCMCARARARACVWALARVCVRVCASERGKQARALAPMLPVVLLRQISYSQFSSWALSDKAVLAALQARARSHSQCVHALPCKCTSSRSRRGDRHARTHTHA